MKELTEQEKQEWILHNEWLQQHYLEYLRAEHSFRSSRKTSKYDQEKVKWVRQLKDDLNWDLFHAYVSKTQSAYFAFDECIDDVSYCMAQCLTQINNLAKEYKQEMENKNESVL